MPFDVAGFPKESGFRRASRMLRGWLRAVGNGVIALDRMLMRLLRSFVASLIEGMAAYGASHHACTLDFLGLERPSRDRSADPARAQGSVTEAENFAARMAIKGDQRINDRKF
jgi:hypothetical protein